MAVIGELTKARGAAGVKVAYVTKSITGTGDITASDLGLKRIIAPICATVVNAANTIPTQIAQITSFDETKVSVVVVEQEASANSISTSAKNVLVVVLGE
jgi:hypothetical protein